MSDLKSVMIFNDLIDVLPNYDKISYFRKYENSKNYHCKIAIRRMRKLKQLNVAIKKYFSCNIK